MSMKITKLPLKDVKNTMKHMRFLCETYSGDVVPYLYMSLPEFYDFVKNIPYRYDLDQNGQLTEILQRPYYTLNQSGLGGDCDDKAICMGAFAKASGFSYRFKAVGKHLQGKCDHVYCEIKLQGVWVPVDATYSYNTFGQLLSDYKKVVTYG